MQELRPCRLRIDIMKRINIERTMVVPEVSLKKDLMSGGESSMIEIGEAP